MLASVLQSKRAVRVNIEIMRAFVGLRRMPHLERRVGAQACCSGSKYDVQFKVVFDAIRELITPPTPKRRKIGFLVEEKAAAYGRRR